MKPYLLLFLLLMFELTLAGCSVFDSDGGPGKVLLRISNDSSIDFESVYVSFPGAEFTFNNVSPGENSRYHEFVNAYRYGYIEVHSADDVYRLQPIDYVGEKPLKSGKYTFKLNIEGDSLIFEFIED